MQELISIIVPVYNAELYICNCIESITQQTYKNIELILINDGSSDNSLKICREFEKRDKRIILIDSENKGPSFARNIGLKIASGEYIQFVDADDRLDSTMSEELYANMKSGYDLVVCGVDITDNNGKVVGSRVPGPYEIKLHDEVINKFYEFYNCNLINSLWNKLYKSSIINENHIKFNEEYRVSEDLQFNIEYLNFCNSFKTIQKSLYMYNIGNGKSIMASYIPNYFDSRFYVIQKIETFLQENKLMHGQNENEFKKHIPSITSRSFTNLFFSDSCLSSGEIKHEINKIVGDKRVRVNLPYFNCTSQNKLLGHFIKKRWVNAIYLFFRFKFIYFKIKNKKIRL